MPKLRLLVVLLAVVDTELWSLAELKAWADRLLLQAHMVETWLVDLSLSQSRAEAEEAVRSALTHPSPAIPPEYDELRLGCLYLLHERGLAERRQTLEKIRELCEEPPPPSILDLGEIAGLLQMRDGQLAAAWPYFIARIDDLRDWALEQERRLTARDLYERERPIFEQ